MKIKIAYTKPEEERAEELAALYIKKMQKHSRCTYTKSAAHDPFLHIYINDGRNANPKGLGDRKPKK